MLCLARKAGEEVVLKSNDYLKHAIAKFCLSKLPCPDVAREKTERDVSQFVDENFSDIIVAVNRVDGIKARMGFGADPELRIYRKEVMLRIEAESDA